MHPTLRIPEMNHPAILAQVDDLLYRIGTGGVDSVPYDTAWLARLGHHFPGMGFDQAREWLREKQLPDGSWGSPNLHYHDRIVCTLAAIIALQECEPSPQDSQRIHHGEKFIWQNLGRLHFDAHDTIGFPVLAVSLIREAKRFNLDVPRDISQNAALIEKKLNLLGNKPELWRFTSLSYSLEAVPPFLPDPSIYASSDFILGNGSIGTSPAATAAYMIYTGRNETNLMNYLKACVEKQGDGGAAMMEPLGLFETAWALDHLHIAQVLDKDHPAVKALLDRLWKAWSPEHGISSSEFFPVPDLDDTATAFRLLHWAGYPVHYSVFEYYEGENYFHCYPGEADVSLSVNIRTLAALREVAGDPQVDFWIDKILFMLRRYDLDHPIWFDKWHVSPYYLLHATVFSLNHYADDLLRPRIRWALRTQQEKGGWGYYGEATLEETALVLDLLLFWSQYTEAIDDEILDRAMRYILQNWDDSPLPALYIGKSLYHPRHIVDATILAALHNYCVYRGI
jgi:halimadienyl-diphosphate synthase